jgi:hypothetical protein
MIVLLRKQDRIVFYASAGRDEFCAVLSGNMDSAQVMLMPHWALPPSRQRNSQKPVELANGMGSHCAAASCVSKRSRCLAGIGDDLLLIMPPMSWFERRPFRFKLTKTIGIVRMATEFDHHLARSGRAELQGTSS